MSAHARPALVAYDIADGKAGAKRRRKVRQRLAEWRLDGQYSLIECRLTQSQADELMLQLHELIDHDADRILLAWLDTRRPARAQGVGSISATEKLRLIH